MAVYKKSNKNKVFGYTRLIPFRVSRVNQKRTSYHVCYLSGSNLLIDVIQEENITLFSNYLSVTVKNELIQYSWMLKF